jgi:hypothetical protein
MVFRPASGSNDAYRPDRWSYGYNLVSTWSSLWKPFLDGTGIGNGKLMDRSFDYKGERITRLGVPRHFDSNRWSAPGKRDAGILPFAFSTRLTAPDLGVLFFDPAYGYSKLFACGEDWSLEYESNPY